jgi:hypothetical protein
VSATLLFSVFVVPLLGYLVKNGSVISLASSSTSHLMAYCNGSCDGLGQPKLRFHAYFGVLVAMQKMNKNSYFEKFKNLI